MTNLQTCLLELPKVRKHSEKSKDVHISVVSGGWTIVILGDTPNIL